MVSDMKIFNQDSVEKTHLCAISVKFGETPSWGRGRGSFSNMCLENFFKNPQSVLAKYCIKVRRKPLQTRADPEGGGGGQGVWTPWKITKI